MLSNLHTDLERAKKLQIVLITRATSSTKEYDENGYEDYGFYTELRKHFIDRHLYKNLLPSFIHSNRSLEEFWQFIKGKFSTYAERRSYIYNEFHSLFDHLEAKDFKPLDENTSATLKSFDEESVHTVWQKALERRNNDPEGAITTSRTLIETICKHILEESNIQYDTDKIELHELYKLTARELNLSPSQHNEEIFRQILGGCSAVINGLGTLRNRLGDAHGKGKRLSKPQPRHAELAVNLAGSMGLFLVSTWQSKKTIQQNFKGLNIV
jgi:Abortive infection C-terminus